MNKTNAMRQLDAAKIKYEAREYEVDENDLSGTHIADEIGLPYEIVFKTIVTKGDKTGYLVFCVPCDKEIDLKKAAAVTGNKKIEPLHVKDLLGLTGYIRGGCSPIGMKKKFPTCIDETAILFDTIGVSAGMRGAQILLNPQALADYIGAQFAELTVEIPDNLKIIDNIDKETGDPLEEPVTYTVDEFKAMLADENLSPDFATDNVEVMFNVNCEMVSVERFYTPAQ